MKLEIIELEKSYGKKEVLKDVTFTFEEGKIYGLLGRNGAGKTTFFNALNSDIPVEKMHFSVAYSGAKTPEVDAWVEEVKTAFPQATIEVIAPLSLSVSCHIGAGALAVTATAPLK